MLNHYFVFEFPFNNVGRLFILFDIFDFTYIVISILEIYAKNFCKIRYLWQEFPIGCVACHLSNGRIFDIRFPIKTRAKLKYPVGGKLKCFQTDRYIDYEGGGTFCQNQKGLHLMAGASRFIYRFLQKLFIIRSMQFLVSLLI